MAEFHNILVVDDDPVLLDIFAQALSSREWTIAPFASSTLARQHLLHRPFSALLTDALPGYDALIADFRKRNPNSPIVVLTGSINPVIETSAREKGANLVLFKPIGIVALRENLQNLIAAAVQELNCEPYPDPEVQVILQIERELIQSWIQGDVKALDRLLGDNYVFVGGASRPQSKRERLQALASGALRYRSVQPELVTATHYADVCVVNATYNLQGELLGKDISGIYRSVRIYRRKQGTWKAVAGQLTQQTAAVA